MGKYSIRAIRGDTYSLQLRWESDQKAYIPISTISNSAPLKITTLDPHQIPDGWRVKAYGFVGMKEFNNSDKYLTAKVVSATEVEINALNSLTWSTYTSGGVLEYNVPIDLNMFSAKLRVFDTETLLGEFSTATGNIILDNSFKTITITIPSSVTSSFDFNYAQYALELTDSSNDAVSTLLAGAFKVI